jgi:hypothetical protein
MGLASTDNDSLPNLTPSEIRRAAKRALTFQRYIFRRSWGIYYAVWATAFAMYWFLLPGLVSILGLSSAENSYAILVSDLVVSIVAGWMSGRIIERARAVIFVREGVQLETNPFQRRRAWLAVWCAYIMAILLTAAFFGSHLLSIAFGLATAVTLVFYYALKYSFPERMPLEGKLAVVVYGTATFSSFLISLLAISSNFYFPIWIATVSVWFGASLTSLLRAPDELTAQEEVVEN